MKVTCQSCQAKYTIADEKVRGKVAKIRCRKCGTTIIVNGTDAAAAGASPSQHPAAPAADFTQQGASNETWAVLVAEGDQRTLTAAQVSELFGQGTVNFETPVWKDGMADWLPIAQVGALRSFLEHGTPASMLPSSAMTASLLPEPSAEPAPEPRPAISAAAAAPPAKPLPMPPKGEPAAA